MIKKLTILIFVLQAAILLAADTVKPLNSKDGVAIRGYDAVAYFNQNKAIKGSDDYQHSWKGVVWKFSNEENLKLFVADPEKYAPQFGGYCAYAASRNYIYDADPEFWKIVDGRLFLNYNGEAQKLWAEDIPGNIKKGNENWPGLLKSKEKKK
jgi:hypothetical protein